MALKYGSVISQNDQIVTFFDEVYALSRSFVRKYHTISADRDDLVQETVMAAFLHKDNYDPSRGSLGNWVHTLMHHIFLDAKQKNNALKRKRPSDYVSTQQRERDPTDTFNERRETFEEVIGRLPVSARQYGVRHTRGISWEIIGEEDGIAAAAAKSRWDRARQAEASRRI